MSARLWIPRLEMELFFDTYCSCLRFCGVFVDRVHTAGLKNVRPRCSFLNNLTILDNFNNFFRSMNTHCFYKRPLVSVCVFFIKEREKALFLMISR